tara:strand:+ start:211 stop:930 length:720 start_codon:yes stop_codon:yes gene_type:complete
MIQATTKTDITTFIQTEDNRIDYTIATAEAIVLRIRHLFKFTNDMDGSVVYTYAATEVIYPRVTKFTFTYDINTDIYLGKVNFLPAGYWKYEVYEVTWGLTKGLTAGYAPVTENDVLTPPAGDKGIVQGLVTKGKMYVAERVGTEEVSYIQNAKSVQTLTIAYAGSGYTSAPTLTITGDCITQATATADILGGVVNSVTITRAGSGYTENPTVTVSGGGATADATVIANIEQTNYIYTG